MSTADYRLHERIDRIADASADRDVLVTLAVPPEMDLSKASERVERDSAEAEYLDTEPVAEPLREALEELRRALGEYDETPGNGLVCYVGSPDGDLERHVFADPPTPVPGFVYETANEFDLGPLEGIRTPRTTAGLLVVERGGAALGRLVGDRVEPIETIESSVPGKSRAGGQSAERFERERERRKREFFETVADEAERAFLEAGDGDEGGAGIDALLLGGTTVTVDEFRRGEYLDYRLEDRLAGDPVAVEYATEQGLEQLAEKGADAIDERDRREARDALERFFSSLAADGGDGGDGDPVAYGRADVEAALEYDAVATALLSTTLSGTDVRELGDRATDAGGDVVLVPPEVPDGERFAEAFGGVAALLRFPIE